MNSIFSYSFDHPWFFTNYSFLIVLGGFLIIYALLYNLNFIRKLYMIIFSLFFYYKSSGPFLIIFVLLILCDYNFAQAIERFKNTFIRKLLLFISIILSLSFLLFQIVPLKELAFFEIDLHELMAIKQKEKINNEKKFFMFFYNYKLSNDINFY